MIAVGLFAVLCAVGMHKSRCPYCREVIQPKATICKHCRSAIDRSQVADIAVPSVATRKKRSVLAQIGRGVLLAFAAACGLVLFIFLAGSLLPKDATHTEASRIEAAKAAPKEKLAATAGCLNGSIVATNNDDQDWTQVKIEINRSYTHEVPTIPSHATVKFSPDQFSSGAGERLNLYSHACQSLDIHAFVGKDRLSWNGAMPR